MSDRIVRTEITGYFERLKNSFIGIFFGIILFLASFGILYWNEGRVNLARVAKTSVEIPATGAATANIGSFVSITGTLTSPETLGDRPFLAEGEYIGLQRASEMYAWDERKKTKTTKNTGGSETKTTTYTYKKTWTENPDNSSSFEEPNGHQNPAKSIESQLLKVTQAQVGDYQLEMSSLNFPISTPVNLTPENVLPEYQTKQFGNFLFSGIGNINAPEIGDIRLSYKALSKNIQATVFGSLASPTQLAPYKAKQKISFYRLFAGNRNRAIASLALEHKIWTWIFRGMGFVVMWIGLSLVMEPLSVVLDFIPFLGRLSLNATDFAAFIIAGILTTGTILISIVLHNPIMLFLAASLSGFVVYR